MIEAINAKLRRQVVRATNTCIEHAEHIFERKFTQIPVKFDLRGRAAGTYQIRSKQQFIRYNPYIFARFFNENLLNTVPHEVAHYVTDEIYGIGESRLFGGRCVRPHGKEWQSIMRKFGVEPRATCHFDMSGLPVRNYQYFSYVCDCREHQLGSRRHNKVLRQQARYLCKDCGSFLSSTV
jgi:SprT protein